MDEFEFALKAASREGRVGMVILVEQGAVERWLIDLVMSAHFEGDGEFR